MGAVRHQPKPAANTGRLKPGPPRDQRRTLKARPTTHPFSVQRSAFSVAGRRSESHGWTGDGQRRRGGHRMLHRDRWSPFSTPAADETADTTSQPVDASSSRTLHTPARHRPRFFDSLLGFDLVVMTRLLFVRFAMSSTARTGGTMGIGASEPGLSPIFPARSSCTSPASLAGDAAFGCRASADRRSPAAFSAPSTRGAPARNDSPRSSEPLAAPRDEPIHMPPAALARSRTCIQANLDGACCFASACRGRGCHRGRESADCAD